jgi:hypothetical protein
LNSDLQAGLVFELPIRMNRYHFSAGLLGIGMMLGAATCKSEEQIRKDCEGVMCTMMFAAVTVQVQDASGNGAALDSARVSSEKLGMSMTAKAGPDGTGYTIVDDGQVKQLARRSGTVTFRGFKGGREVVRQDFMVKADCCHVSKVSGPDVVTPK